MSEVNSLIQFMGLDSLLTQKLIQISGEDRLKVALVKTMTMRPKALLLDEPFRFLTRSGSDSVRQCIRDILRYYNICALVTGSRYEDVCSFTDRVFCLKEGILTPFQELNDRFAHCPQAFVCQAAFKKFPVRLLTVKKKSC